MAEKGYSFFRGWRLLFLIYILLLLASHIWRALKPVQQRPDPGQETITIHQVDGDSVLTDRELNIAYRDIYHGTEKNPPVVLILHGSPVGVSMFPQMLDRLAQNFRVLAPDFPGYDASDRDIPDYSVEAFSVYMNQFLDSLSVEKAHVAGYSLGGGVGIYMSHLFPDRVKSLTLISSIGVQELELLGNYTLNRLVHGGQLALIWFLHEGIPHFGYFDDFVLNVPYARSFYDSDQRPLRGFLKEYKKPMLILHGKGDGLVPVAAAKEHHRIVPQSKLILYEGGHGIIISRVSKMVEDISQFIPSVEQGEATDYATAQPERIREARKPFDKVHFAEAEGITLFVIMLLIVLATFISEDLTCIGAGLMAAKGIIGFWPAAAACLIGIFVGDIGLYLAGRWLGRPAIRHAPFKWFISEADLEKSAEWFKARGPAIIIASRFVPGSRFPTYFSSGVIGAGFFMFTFYLAVAAVVWTPILVGISMLVGSELIRYFEVYQNYAIWVVLGTILILVIFIKVVIPLFSWKGRRLVLSRWRRMTRWEFWPPYILYLPVLGYIVYLWFKYGKLTAFTAANPEIPDGGFIGESKSDILKSFTSSESVASFRVISGELSGWEKFLAARKFMKDHDLDYPVVIKPDVGQRGKGVTFPKNERELKDVLENREKGDLIVQQFIPGREFGVFYYRYPDQDKGDIFSITDKRLLTLEGDGKSTLEELILKDDRAVCLAKYHFSKHADKLYEIPDRGETIQLVELGTHAMGALFLDGSELITPQLIDSIDRLAKQSDGFYFGRMDIKTPSGEDLKRGDNLTIVEVNGVTSEATSIYDPDNSFFNAQKKLMEQWRIAFEIGTENRKRGNSISSVSILLKKLISFYFT